MPCLICRSELFAWRIKAPYLQSLVESINRVSLMWCFKGMRRETGNVTYSCQLSVTWQQNIRLFGNKKKLEGILQQTTLHKMSPSIEYVFKIMPPEYQLQGGKKDLSKINCQKFNELLLCIINLHGGYSRASLWILLPCDRMWLNMMPFPQPAAPLHNTTAQSVSIIFSNFSPQ